MKYFVLISLFVLLLCSCTSQEPAVITETVDTLESETFSDLIVFPDTMYYYKNGDKIAVTENEAMGEIYDLVILGLDDFVGAYAIEPEPGALDSAFEVGLVLELCYDETMSGVWNNVDNELYEYDIIQIIIDCPQSEILNGKVYGFANGAFGPFNISTALLEKLI